jgi:hypothetical protein
MKKNVPLEEMEEYIVTKGIFAGLVFMGHPIVINNENRIWNDDSTGQCFPAADCLSAKYACTTLSEEKNNSRGFDAENS